MNRSGYSGFSAWKSQQAPEIRNQPLYIGSGNIKHLDHCSHCTNTKAFKPATPTGKKADNSRTKGEQIMRQDIHQRIKFIVNISLLLASFYNVTYNMNIIYTLYINITYMPVYWFHSAVN